MGLLVKKFGGTSVDGIVRLRNVARIIGEARRRGHQVVAVVSAGAGETNRLGALAVQAAREVPEEGRDEEGQSQEGQEGQEVQAPDPAELDALLSCGEQVSAALLSQVLIHQGFAARSFNALQLGLRTDSSHGRARIRSIDCRSLRAELAAGRVPVVTGFQGIDAAGRITTLGRGGSDTTAVALAAALRAEECLIYTDVDGVYTADPRLVPDARLLPRIGFEEMLELASLGSRVVQIRAVDLAGKYRVPVRVLSSFRPGPGTLLDVGAQGWADDGEMLPLPGSLNDVEDQRPMETLRIAGVAHNRDEAKLTVLGIPDVPGAAFKVLGPVGEAGIEVDVIVQSAAPEGGVNDLSFTVHRRDYERARTILEQAARQLGARGVSGGPNVAKVSLVGVGMRSHAGVAGRMFDCLAQTGINIQLITTSEIKISVIIEESHMEKAVRCLHETFSQYLPARADAEAGGDAEVDGVAGRAQGAGEAVPSGTAAQVAAEAAVAAVAAMGNAAGEAENVSAADNAP